MNYEVIFTEKSVKDLKKLDKNIKKRILEKIIKFSKSPVILRIGHRRDVYR